MSSADIWMLVVAAVLVLVAGVLASAEAALSSISKVRADELVEAGRSGAQRLRGIVDDAPRYRLLGARALGDDVRLEYVPTTAGDVGGAP